MIENYEGEGGGGQGPEGNVEILGGEIRKNSSERRAGKATYGKRREHLLMNCEVRWCSISTCPESNLSNKNELCSMSRVNIIFYPQHIMNNN